MIYVCVFGLILSAVVTTLHAQDVEFRSRWYAHVLFVGQALSIDFVYSALESIAYKY